MYKRGEKSHIRDFFKIRIKTAGNAERHVGQARGNHARRINTMAMIRDRSWKVKLIKMKPAEENAPLPLSSLPPLPPVSLLARPPC